MFIGHLPAGYILTKVIHKKTKINKFLWVGLLGSIFPDFDLFYFYLIDGRQTLHHSYWIHIPFYWILIAGSTLFVFWVLKKRNHFNASLIFFTAVFFHLVLDTIVGKIEWLFPFSREAYYLFEVPAVYDFWVFNFIFHWTFLFEIAVITWSIYLFFQNKKLIKESVTYEQI